jgi:hypothetical protein
VISALMPLEQLAHARVLVTGASGSIGSAVVDALRGVAIATYPSDIVGAYWQLDVCDDDRVADAIKAIRPTHVLHLAGEKHAPEGELDPVKTTRTNIEGTVNVLRHAGGARVVTASTCKACDPETVYGASKLIAERMTLNAGGSVARFYNVVESSGNVFRLWESLPADEPLPVAPCERYFVSLADAVAARSLGRSARARPLRRRPGAAAAHGRRRRRDLPGPACSGRSSRVAAIACRSRAAATTRRRHRRTSPASSGSRARTNDRPGARARGRRRRNDRGRPTRTASPLPESRHRRR